MLNITLLLVTLASLLTAIKVYGHYTKQFEVLKKRISNLEYSRDMLLQEIKDYKVKYDHLEHREWVIRTSSTSEGWSDISYGEDQSTTATDAGGYVGTGNGY